MIPSDRSRLRTYLRVWMFAWVTGVLGYCAAVAVFAFGLYQGVKVFTSDAPPLPSIGAMIVGCGLQGFIVALFIRVRERFEQRCWELISSELGRTDDGRGAEVLQRLADGEALSVTEVRTHQSRRFFKRLLTLIEYAWPDHARN